MVPPASEGATGLQTAVITGASSGVGEATARALAELQLDLVLVARRRERLDRIGRELQATGRRVVPIAADLRDPLAAQGAMETALAELGHVDALVNCLGTNVPDRSLALLSAAGWDDLLATNLSAIFYCVRAVLPSMRSRGSGAIVSISSIAGKWPSALSGAAYSSAKAGLNALSRCINLEEAGNGIRSCVIAPGDIDTELLDRRPTPPPPESRAAMLHPVDVARCVVTVLGQSERSWIDELTVRPRSG